MLWVVLAKDLEDLKIHPMILSNFPSFCNFRTYVLYYGAHRLIPLFSLTNCLGTIFSYYTVYSTCRAGAFMTLVQEGLRNYITATLTSDRYRNQKPKNRCVWLAFRFEISQPTMSEGRSLVLFCLINLVYLSSSNSVYFPRYMPVRLQNCISYTYTFHHKYIPGERMDPLGGV